MKFAANFTSHRNFIFRSDVESDDYESSRKKKRPELKKTAEKKKRSSSRSKAHVQDADSSSAAEYDRKKKHSSLRSKARKYDREESPPTPEYDRKKKYSSSGKSRARKHDKSGSLTPDSSVERSPEVAYRDEGKKHSRNRSKEKQQKREKEAAPQKHHNSSKRKSSPVDSDEDDFRESRISDRSSKTATKEKKSHGKKSSPDRRQKRRSSSVEERRRGEYKSESSTSKRKRHDSSSDREFVEKRSRRADSREKSTRKRETSRDRHAKPFYGKKTRLTVSDSESDRSSSSQDRRKVKSKSNHKSNRIDANARFGSSAATKHKNRFPSRHESDSEQSAEEPKASRDNRRPPFEKARIESSKTFKNYASTDKSKSLRNDSDKNVAEGAKTSPLVQSQPEVALRMTTPSKIIDNRHNKAVIVAQRNGVETAAAVENGTNADGSITNRDSSTSSSLSYSPMEKYPHRYKDILTDVSKKGQKSDLSVRRSEIQDRLSPVKSDDRGKKENDVKPPDAKEKPQSVSTTKNDAARVGESKSENSFCVSEVPLPPIGGSSSTMKSPAIKHADVAAEALKKSAKLIDSTSALVKSIPPALSQKPNTLASSISDVIAKSMQKRDASSSSESLRKRKSRSSSKSSSSSDSSLRYVLLALRVVLLLDYHSLCWRWRYIHYCAEMSF